MSPIHIVTDSTSDIPAEVRKRLGIEMVPLKVHFGKETYQDAVTIQTDEFYRKLVDSKELPTTSQPSPVEFVDVYKRLLEDPDAEILSIHLSSALSGTYQSAVLAKSLLNNSPRITVIDSKSASYGFGMLVVAAAELAKQDANQQDIQDKIRRMRGGTRLYFLVDTLEYLYKGGRIGKASALFGSLLNIKPILTIDDEGEVTPVDKVRGHKKAVARIISLLKEDFADQPIHLTVANGKAPDAAQELEAMVKENLNAADSLHTVIGPVIGTHVGPGVIAVFASRA
ncbi:DegV family protein [Ferviditalea candida]|uniref:DegV family protein n=1 Tax=Ferviditalea candida TaxID=3108399 RepID=A0ABU5ZFD9_9BACL|nr:DegV family protein [Paenibacillaceae bacterium T2]